MLADAKEGHAESWRRLVHLYAPLVLHWCRNGFPPRQPFPALCGVPDRDVGDVVQEVFLTTAKRIKDFTKDGQPAAFRRWLYSITGFKVLEYWGLVEQEPIDGIGSWLGQIPDRSPPPKEDPSATEDVPERILLFRRILELIRPEFEPHTWEAFWKVAMEGRPAEDVAKELGMKRGAVYTAKSRVLKRLREEGDALGLHQAGEKVAAVGDAQFA
jgi:RNA polymerase sigma-70 factor (ECF subfamily)